MTLGAATFYPAGPIAIRDGTAACLEAVPGLTQIFSGRTMPGQDSQLPYAIVWLGGEQTEPNGDANAGVPSFIHRLSLYVDVLAAAPSGSTPDDAEAALDADIVAFAETIRATLLTDTGWLDLVEGIERCNTRYHYPKEGQAIMVQATIEFEVTFRSDWEPFLGNDLREVTVTVGADPKTQLRQSFPLRGSRP